MADQDLADVIAIVESSGFHGAPKFEKGLFHHWDIAGQPLKPTPESIEIARILDIIRAANHCDRDTATMIATTSWGYYQLLGENIWNRGFMAALSLADFLIDASGVQGATFDRFLTQKGINVTLSSILTDDQLMIKFVTAYNGPGDVADYANRIRQVAATKFPPNMTQVQQ